MATPLLRTKLYIPPAQPRERVVARPHLVARLDAGLRSGSRLALISAPAGFGKTTLLSEWIHQDRMPVAWVSLDKNDNDPARFWSYVIAALQTIRPGIGTAALAALRASGTQIPPTEVLLTGLINELAAPDPLPVVLVLDDLHTVTEPQIHEALTFFIDNLPAGVHLVLSTRADPPWPLARMRARREMTELRTEDLRFATDEAAAFLNDTMGLALSTEAIAALDAHTEGWIAGLQMAALSMRGRDAESFVQAFGGSHRFILDYLVEEVLDRQPQEIQAFLLQTSILERMCADLCDAVVEGEEGKGERGKGGKGKLGYIERSNLFLIPLDDERRWYRYHHLFADLLRGRLAQAGADQIPALHRRACEWYERNGLIAEALSHALQAEDVRCIVRLVADNALNMMEHGELRTLERLLEALPEEMVRTEPWICIARAWMLMFTGRLDAVEPLLQRADEALPEDTARHGRARAAGHILAIRAGVAHIRGDLASSEALSREALDHLAEDDLMARGWVTANLATTLSWSGKPAESEAAFRRALAISEARRDGYVSVMALSNIAVVQVERGQLRKAAATFREAIHRGHEYAGRSGQPLHVASYAYIYLADLLREWNDLEPARAHMEQGIALCSQWGEPQLLASGYAKMAKLLQTVGDAQGAREAMRIAAETAETISDWYVERIAADHVCLLLAQGDVTGAAQVAASGVREVDVDAQSTLRDCRAYRAWARLSLAQGDLDRALGLLEGLPSAYEAFGSQDLAIDTLVLQAVILWARRDLAQALASLGRALALGEAEGYVRAFIDEGAPMRELLHCALVHGVAVDYVQKLIAALEEEAPARPTAARRAAAPLPLVEPLSERELDVLRLLRSELSSTEIAQALYISKNTARTHIAHIYDKLGVHSRTDAVTRGEELGLI